MTIDGWYYLDAKGEIKYKAGAQAGMSLPSQGIKGMWPFIPTDRYSAWNMVVEAASIVGVKHPWIVDKIALWELVDSDAANYAERVGCFLNQGMRLDGKFAWYSSRLDYKPNVSHVGVGDTAIEAMADLCHKLGYRGSVAWRDGFKCLLSLDRKPRELDYSI